MIATIRKPPTFRLDGDRLRAERAKCDEPDPDDPDKLKRTSQREMADLIRIGLSAYQKAERGECVAKRIADKIKSRLRLDDADLGVRPCIAAPPNAAAVA